MNRKLMPFMLLLIEVVMYYFICLYFHMDLDLIIGSGILYFLFLFIYGHYSLNTCLIWDEIKALLNQVFVFISHYLCWYQNQQVMKEECI